MYNDLRSAYIGLYSTLRQEGYWIPNNTFEATHVSVTVRNPIQPVIPLSSVRFNRRYFAGEFIAHIQGDNSYERMVGLSKMWRKHSDDGVTINSVYGHTVDSYHGWDFVIDAIRNDPECRKCYLPLFLREHAKPLKDNPCNVGIHFMRRRHKLYVHLIARSIDMCYGLPVDWAFTIIMQRALAWCLDLRIGHFTHSISSLHVYEKDFKEWLGYDFNQPDNFERLLPVGYIGQGGETRWDEMFPFLKGNDVGPNSFEHRIQDWAELKGNK